MLNETLSVIFKHCVPKIARAFLGIPTCLCEGLLQNSADEETVGFSIPLVL